MEEILNTRPSRQAPRSGTKIRGNLAVTLDPLLRPRRSAGAIGRPKGARNYEWTPELDQMLVDMSKKRGPAAKRTVARALQHTRPTAVSPTPDSLRKAMEYRMAKLGISSGEKRREPGARLSKRWTEAQTAALLGALRADAAIESIALRTRHSVKAVRAKIARLSYDLSEIHGFAVFTVSELAELLHVTPRQIRRWKERGWLETKGRITEKCLGRFLQEHSDRVPFDSLGREDQIYLLDLGFPRREAVLFKKNVREILDGIGRQQKPKRPGISTNETTTSELPHKHIVRRASGSEADRRN
jgi:hypothetical protein